MRKNVAAALATFDGSRNYFAAPSVRATPNEVYSYNTCIAARHVDGRVILNVTRYSVTTSALQNALRFRFPNAIQVSPLSKGASENDLRVAALMSGYPLNV